MNSEERRSRFVGALLGTAFGDALGAAVEMMSRDEIIARFGQVRDFLPHSKGLGSYTDDTEMTLALVRSLVDIGGVDAYACSQRYAEAFSPERGYGRSAVLIMEALADGADYRNTGTMFFSEGSFGNGAAMRIAPIGLFYAQAGEPVLRDAVFAAVHSTHRHQEAIEAACLQAIAVAMMLGQPMGASPDSHQIIGRLKKVCRVIELSEALDKVTNLLVEGGDADQVSSTFGCGVRSADSWPPALWAALRYADDPQEAIIQAVNLGGDTDTIGAMTGALVGALHGEDWFPPSWYAQLENGPAGRDDLIRSGLQLADLAGTFRVSGEEV